MEQEDQYREVLTVSKETEKTETTQSRCCNKYVFYHLGVVAKCHGKFMGWSQPIF